MAYRVRAEEVSLFNSLLAGYGLLGILIAIFAASVTLQRLNIELKIAQSFNNLVSRRNSATPATVYATTPAVLPEKANRSRDVDPGVGEDVV